MGYADLLGLAPLVVLVVVVVATVKVERGSVEVDTPRLGHSQALGGLAGDAHEHLGEASITELVQDSPQPIVVEVLGLYPRADQVLGCLTGKELLEEVKRS